MDPLLVALGIVLSLLTVLIGAFVVFTYLFTTIAMSSVDPLDYYLDYDEEPTKK